MQKKIMLNWPGMPTNGEQLHQEYAPAHKSVVAMVVLDRDSELVNPYSLCAVSFS